MRRFGSNKKNPNPPWPCRQPVIVVPPGMNGTSLGSPNEIIHNIKELGPEVLENNADISEDINKNQQTAESNIVENAFENREFPIMGFMSQNNIENTQEENICVRQTVSKYMCGKIGKFAKIEFMFGENTHVEKIGEIESLGRDFIVIKEMGTNTHIVCSMKSIKFINIYDSSDK